MYKLLSQTQVQRIADGATIPFEEGNRDYREYLDWVAEGNTPNPIDPPPPPDTRRATLRQAIDDVDNEPGMNPRMRQFVRALKDVF